MHTPFDPGPEFADPNSHYYLQNILKTHCKRKKKSYNKLISKKISYLTPKCKTRNTRHVQTTGKGNLMRTKEGLFNSNWEDELGKICSPRPNLCCLKKKERKIRRNLERHYRLLGAKLSLSPCKNQLGESWGWGGGLGGDSFFAL